MTLVQEVGPHQSVAVKVAAWDSVNADADLSCACMFTHEAHGAKLHGGLAHLDDVSGGMLQSLRREGLFAGRRGETLFISSPPRVVIANNLLVIGLGDPEDWSPQDMEVAVGQAVTAALLRKARSVAFAASMLDGGLTPGETAGAATCMVRGFKAALNAASRLNEAGMLEHTNLESWTFDVGAERFEAAVQQFRIELSAPFLANTSFE